MNEVIDTLEIYNYVGNAIILILSILCIISCIIVIYICLTKCDRKASEIILICLFCSLEAANGLGYIINSIYKLILGYKISESGRYMCIYSAFFLSSFTRVSLIGISVLATLRYLIVCHQKEVKLWIWVLIFAIPSIAIIIFYSLVFYTNDASPLSSKLYCSPFAKKSDLSEAMLYLIPFFYIIPCWISTYCYFMVGWTANKRLNLMKKEAVDNSDESLLISIKRQKLKLWMQILFVFYIYNANFCLSYITWIMRLATNYKRPVLVDAIVYLQVTSTAFLNPIIAIIFQPDINHEFKFLLIKFKAKINKLINL